MATSKINSIRNIVENKTGSVSVPPSTVTALNTLNVPDTNAYYLIVAQVSPTDTQSGKYVQVRMTGGNVRGELRTSICTIMTRIVKGNGSTITISTYQDGTEAQTINYNLTAVKLF